MSRLIKFRVWDSASKKMISNEFIEKFRLFGLAFIAPDPTFSMQYTGINDKNGVEIYEGDIIRLESWGFYVAVIKFKNGMFFADWIDSNTLRNDLGNITGDIEVIGNIHENPELLES